MIRIFFSPPKKKKKKNVFAHYVTPPSFLAFRPPGHVKKSPPLLHIDNAYGIASNLRLSWCKIVFVIPMFKMVHHICEKQNHCKTNIFYRPPPLCYLEFLSNLTNFMSNIRLPLYVVAVVVLVYRRLSFRSEYLRLFSLGFSPFNIISFFYI